jgi:hypothetical protein
MALHRGVLQTDSFKASSKKLDIDSSAELSILSIIRPAMPSKLSAWQAPLL